MTLLLVWNLVSNDGFYFLVSTGRRDRRDVGRDKIAPTTGKRRQFVSRKTGKSVRSATGSLRQPGDPVAGAAITSTATCYELLTTSKWNIDCRVAKGR
jgi:hypothetical protein